MINLDYYFRSNIYELDNILSKGLFFDYYKTAREYGFSIYLVDKPSINLNNQNLVVNVHLKNLNNILIVTNFQELLTNYLPSDVNDYVDKFGKTARLGTKYIQKKLEIYKYNGLKVTSENLLVLYNNKNINYTKLFNI